MANNEKSVTRVVKWTINNVTEPNLKLHNNNKRINSPKFGICFDGKLYEWHLQAYVADDGLGFYLMFERNDVQDLTINFKIRVGKDPEKSFTFTRKTALSGTGYGWGNLFLVKDLMVPRKGYVDANKRLIFEGSITLGTFKAPVVSTPVSTGGNSYGQFLDDDDFSDASFTCSDNVKIEVHRVLLIQKSAEFKKIFSEMKKQKKRNQKLNDIDSATMKEILKFAYTGNADLKDIQLVKKIYEASITYDIPELQIQCVDSLNNQITIDNVLDIFGIANQLKLEDVTEKCLQNIMKFYHRLKPTQKWKELSMELKEEVTDGFTRFADNYCDIELESTI